MSYPDDNPKTAVGVTKAPLHLVPPVAVHHTALAFNDGAVKYGPYNWREHKVSASIYIAAAKRHLDAWWDGEENAADSGVNHLGHAMACMAILLDAASIAQLNDDRPLPGAASRLQAEFAAQGKAVRFKDFSDISAEEAERLVEKFREAGRQAAKQNHGR